MPKQRITVTVDAPLAEMAQDAVARGDAESLSSWVAEAMQLQADKDERRLELEALIADYEAEHGEITEAEIAEQSQRDRDAAGSIRSQAREANARRTG